MKVIPETSQLDKISFVRSTLYVSIVEIANRINYNCMYKYIAGLWIKHTKVENSIFKKCWLSDQKDHDELSLYWHKPSPSIIHHTAVFVTAARQQNRLCHRATALVASKESTPWTYHVTEQTVEWIWVWKSLTNDWCTMLYYIYIYIYIDIFLLPILSEDIASLWAPCGT